MAGTADDPFRAASPGAGRPPRRRPRLIDWRRGARLLAAGQAPAAVAASLGIDAEHLWRHLEKSPRFQTYIRQAREQLLARRPEQV